MIRGGSLSKRDLFFILFTSVCLILAFPPFPLGSLAFVTLVPFYFFLQNKSLWSALRAGFLVGLIWGSGTIYWIGWATVPGLIGTLLVFAFFFAFYGFLQGWLLSRWGDRALWSAPFIWTTMEILSGTGPAPFPWNTLANTQTFNIQPIQYVSITGMYGVTFFIVLVNVLLYRLIRTWNDVKKRILILSSLVILLVAPWIHGQFVLNKQKPYPEDLKISLVQGNVDPFKKWTSSFIDSNFVIYKSLSLQAAKEKPDLVVWPETAAPSYLRRRTIYYRRIRDLVETINVPVLTGAPDYEWRDRGAVTFNAAFLILPERHEMDVYHKLRLVPFSEHVPFSEKLPGLFSMLDKLDLGIGHYAAGDSMTVFRFYPRNRDQEAVFSVGICYDSVFPFVIRRAFRDSARFLIVITNDGWFGDTSGPVQHAKHAILRAIENRTWIARCANTGISEFIDPLGHVVASTSYNETAVLTRTISFTAGRSFFTEHGHLFTWFITMVSAGIVALSLFIRRKERI